MYEETEGGSHRGPLTPGARPVGPQQPANPHPSVPLTFSGDPSLPPGLPQDSYQMRREPVWLAIQAHQRMFQPAVLSTAVWRDFLPFREFQVSPSFAFLTTATARYPWTNGRASLNLPGPGPWTLLHSMQPRPTKVKKHHQAAIPQMTAYCQTDQHSPKLKWGAAPLTVTPAW